VHHSTKGGRVLRGAAAPLAATVVLMNLSVMLESVVLAMGRPRTVLVTGLVGSWAGQVPAVALLVAFWQRSLSAVFLGVALGYGLLCMLLAVAILRADWSALACEAAERAGAGRGGSEEPRAIASTVRAADCAEDDGLDDCTPACKRAARQTVRSMEEAHICPRQHGCSDTETVRLYGCRG
jgi:hypothetical protein